jgi:hypothetical protein
MKKLTSVILLMGIIVVPSFGHALTACKKCAVHTNKHSRKSKMKLTDRQVAKIEKKALRDWKRHEFEERYIGYNEMVKARERGMKQARGAAGKGS